MSCNSGPAAGAQFFVAEKLFDSSAINTISHAVSIAGALDAERLAVALRLVAKEQPSLRGNFVADGNTIEFRQRTLLETGEILPVREFAGDGAALRKELADLLESVSSEANPWTAKLLRHSAQSHTLMFCAHRSIWDEQSTLIFGSLLSAKYASTSDKAGLVESDSSESSEESGYEADPHVCDVENGATFFANSLDGVPPVHRLPVKGARQRLKLGHSGSRTVSLLNLDSKIRSLSDELQISEFEIATSALAYVVAQYCGHSKVAFGLPFDQRASLDRRNELGSFTAMLPVGIETELDTFAQLCRHIHDLCAEGAKYCRTSVADIMQRVREQPDPAANALFQVACVAGSDLVLSFPECVCESLPIAAPPQQVDLFFSCFSDRIRIDYSGDLIADELIENIASSIEVFLTRVVEGPHDPLGQQEFLSTEERERVLWEFNDTINAPFANADLNELIARGIHDFHDKKALVCGAASLSYGELDTVVGHAAASLVASGAKPGDLVGICMARSIDMVIAVLATIRAGCAYVPLDPAFPSERLEYMIDHSKLSRVFSDGTLPLTNKSIDTIRLERDNETLLSQPFPPISVEAGSPAYVIYTSGSTGLPKGVVVPRGAASNFLLSMIERPGLSHDDVLCAVTTLSFDISVLELLAPLCSGATVVIATEDEARDPRRLLRLLDATSANVLQATPATWQLLCAAGWKGNRNLKALCGGEALRPTLAHELLERVGELWNMYGPTETTVWSTCKRIVDAAAPITVGRPIHNTAIYVLDKHRRPVPQGVEGDIWIAGCGVTNGYLHNEQLTAERFVRSPFAGDTMYNTGDRGRLDINGELVVLGRSDFQVKIRGFRIELGDVEAALARMPAVGEVVCVAQDVGDSMELIAFYSLRDGRNTDISALRAHCEASLPAHMIPSRFVRVQELPKTPNGKMDRKALPRIRLDEAVSRPAVESEQSAPRDGTERCVLGIFRKVLKRGDISPRDSFFESGGTSLTAFSVVQEIESQTGIELSVLRLFEFPTAQALAAHLGGNREAMALVDDIVQRARYRRMAVDFKTDVAIIGAAGRFPGARTLRELWDNLAQGRETVTFFAREELDPLVPAEDREDEAYIPARGVLEDAQLFDAEFFGITPNEAELMDPQLRVFMEVAWEAFEDAGYVGEDVDGLVGVWGGMGNNFYYHHNVLTRADKLAVMGEIAAEIANEKDHVAPRVSHKLNLTGPSLSVHAACSTGLVAVDNAYQALITHQVDCALAGAVDIRTPQRSGQRYEEGGVFSIDGHCRPFDADATGTMFGEGVGIVVLKRLEDALRDGDAIRAVIKGAATNHDGGEKGSYLSPSVEGQARVVATAMALGDVRADTITFMEAHGTATPIGDPIEVEALTRVYRTQTQRKNYCALGSVKGNFGHATTAAGIAGLLKLTLSLEHRKIPGTLHFRKPNPRIAFDESPFFVNSELIDWVRPEHAPRRGSTSSFGFCGTNAHVVVEEAPEREPSGPPARPAQLMLVSGKNVEAMKLGSVRLGEALEGISGNELADAAYTTHIGRRHFDHRRCAVVIDGEAMTDTLRQAMGPRTMSVAANSKQPPLTFMFPGQGSQYINMGISLYGGERVFRAAVDRCADELEPHLGCDLRDFLFPEPGDEKRATQSLNNTFYTQPAIFTISYALAMQLMHWGLKPDAFIGHSIGEFVAATLSGVMQLSDALRLVATRGRLMKSLPEGSMLSVRLGASEVEGDLPSGLDLAAANGPELCVVAGPTEDLLRYAGYLEEQDVKCRILHTSHAFHSSMMDPVVEPFEEVVRGITLAAPRVPFVSTVTGAWITAEEATDPGYWARHLRSPVLFASAVSVLLQEPERVMIECGPRRTLSTLALQQRPKRPGRVFSCMPDSAEPADEYVSLLMAVGSSWANGCEVDWRHFHEDEKRRRFSLPTYAFQRKRYWIEPGARNLASADSQPEAIAPESLQLVAGAAEPGAPDGGNPLMHSVVRLLEESLGGQIPDFDPDAPFIMLGLDSLLLTQLARTLRVKLGFRVSFRQLTEQFSTPRLLVDAIAAERPELAADAPASAANERPVAPPEHRSEAPVSTPQAPAVEATTATSAITSLRLPGVAGERIELQSTPGQLEMWLTQQAAPESACAFNEAFQIELRGQIDDEALTSALRALPAWHPALRGTFSSDGERFIIHSKLDVTVETSDLTQLSPEEQDAELSRIAANDSSSPYELVEGPLCRFSLIRLGAERCVVLLSAHHAVCDGWSLDVLLADLGRIYKGFVEGKLPALPEHSFIDFVKYRDGHDYQELIQASKSFWQNSLQPIPGPLALPNDRKRPVRRTYRARHCLHEANSDTHAIIRDFAQRHGLSFFAVLMAGYLTLLHRLSGNVDIVVGTPVAAHPEAGMEDCVGHLASMVPVRCQIDPGRPFAEFCREVSSRLLDAREHASVGFGEIVAQLGGSRDPSRVPLVAAVITHVQRYRADQLDFAGCAVDYHLSPRSAEVFELNLNVIEAADSLTFKGHVNADLFSEQWLHWRLLELEHLLREACGDPAQSLENMSLMPAAELQFVKEDVNPKPSMFPSCATLVELLERQVQITPDALAVVQGRDSITLAQLHEEADRIAQMLRARGAGPGGFVGICVNRTIDMVRAVLAVLKSGAAYVPLDPAFPQNRIAYMIEHAGIDLVVSERVLRDVHRLPKENVLDFEDIRGRLGDPAQLSLPIERAALFGDSPAYVLYTSGSTGKPKGVIVPHKAAVNFLQSMAETPGLRAADSLLAVTTLSFDISVLELLLPLSVGARIVLATKEQTLDGQALMSMIEEHSISVMQATPITWRLLIEAGWPGGNKFKALCGGEAMPVDLADELLGRVGELWNMYGPTETTVWSTCCRVTDSARITVGKPIANTIVRILDSKMRPCPVGVPGEIHIGGQGVSLGYLNQPDLTAERFVTDPIAGVADAILYKTGDLGRWLPDLELDCLGRNDNQIKLRGFRIELGEIEAAMASHPDIQEAAAHVHVTGDIPPLVGYVILKPGVGSLPEGIESHLSQFLPRYMIPTIFEVMETFPCTANGKLDRKSLPQPNSPVVAAITSGTAARNDTEAKVREIFVRHLRVPTLGVADDFFDVGGHSLLAVRAVNEVNAAFRTNISVATLFEHPTVEGMAKAIEAGDGHLSDAVIQLHEATSERPPFYFICGIALYQPLALNMGDAFSSYGIYIPQEEEFFARHDSNAPVTVQDLARQYAEAIVRHPGARAGTCYLGGVSFGGLLAFEVARQLDARDDFDVASLVLLDTVLPSAVSRNVRASLVHHLRKTQEGGIAYLGDKIRKRFEIQRATTEQAENPNSEVSNDARLWRALNGRAVRSYLESNPRFRGDSLIVRATDRSSHVGINVSKDLGWQSLLAGPVCIVEAPGDHLGILHHQDTAALIVDHLAELDVQTEAEGA